MLNAQIPGPVQPKSYVRKVKVKNISLPDLGLMNNGHSIVWRLQLYGSRFWMKWDQGPPPNGYPIPTCYTIYFWIPDPIRFSFENNWVMVKPKFWQLTNISGIPDFSSKPEISGRPKHEEVYKTFLHIHSIISSLFERFVKFHFNLWNGIYQKELRVPNSARS